MRKEHSLNIPQGGINTQRRIVIHRSNALDNELFDAVHSASLARSLICDFCLALPLPSSELLRILRATDKEFLTPEGGYSLDASFQLFNSRHIEIHGVSDLNFTYPSSPCLLWNLHTLIVRGEYEDIIAPVEIWRMPQLRHVEFDELYLPDPPCGQLEGGDDCVLENLQSLLNILDFQCTEEIVKKIPNVKKLVIFFSQFYSVCNLWHLQKLESLDCSFFDDEGSFFDDEALSGSDLLQNRTFPHSLKKLTLHGSRLRWEDMTTKIGSLPLLEVLKLSENSFIGSKWETVEGQFPNLKFLLIGDCFDLEEWITDSTHFPRLERLVLGGLDMLKEIPWGIGEIPTLQSIEFDQCCNSVVISAKELQEELSDVDWKVRVLLLEKNQVVESLAGDNFLVEGNSEGDSD